MNGMLDNNFVHLFCTFHIVQSDAKSLLTDIRMHASVYINILLSKYRFHPSNSIPGNVILCDSRIIQ